MWVIAQLCVALQCAKTVIVKVANSFDMQPAKNYVPPRPTITPNSVDKLGLAVEPPEQEQITGGHALIAQVAKCPRNLTQRAAPTCGATINCCRVDIGVQVAWPLAACVQVMRLSTEIGVELPVPGW
ncbi:hypothetical protein D6858_00190 [Tsuneonella suprasediminis]|uniref:Uncharacterized protein n=1 Tax=Tsuneonella suprasediminis TaxID=2306996 RepID=A0A419R6J3_9SPHN|nr:hypothetical protein D6858_00190 [Tsuneonella suprasediminis]